MIYPNQKHELESLRRSALFSACSDEELIDILRFTDRRHLQANQILVYQDEACSAFFQVTHGYVKLYRTTGCGERVMGFAESGDTFAEAAVFCGEGYPYSAVALEDTEVLAFQAFPLSRFIQQSPLFSSAFIACLSRHLRHQTIQQACAAAFNADQRLASFLLGGPEAASAEETDSARRLPGRRRDLANLLAMTPETLCRVMGRFRRSGWIEENSGYVTITAREQLHSLLAQSC